jgi:hypothetical protein
MSKGRWTIADLEQLKQDPHYAAQLAQGAPNLMRERGPNLSEQTVLGMLGFRPEHFESRTFRMANGHEYTPDAFDGRRCLEVKGFRHASHGRSRLAFDQCRAEFPHYVWIWAERKKAGKKGARWVFEFYE